MAARSEAIRLSGITRRFGAFTALDDVDLDVGRGELVALLGPSGSGKTTLLRVVAGLERPDSGEVRLHGEDATDRDVRERRIGFVFQHYALFRHMSVFENVAFGLRVRPRRRRPAEAEIRSRVSRLLDLVQIGELGDRHPNQLSGGQRQRVALARTLAVEPSLLLLDEPFGALDAKVRKELRRWLRGLHDALGMTTVFVTHDQEEALELADRVVVMGDGRVVQTGAPEAIYGAPSSPFVYDFLGHANRLLCEVRGGAARVAGVEIERAGPRPAADGVPPVADGMATLFVRPHDIALTRAPDSAARIKSVNAAGPVVRLEVDVPGSGRPLDVEMAHDRHAADGLAPGDPVSIRFRRVAVFAGV